MPSSPPRFLICLPLHHSPAVPRLFTPTLAEFYEGFYASKGVTINKGQLAVGFTTDESGHVSERDGGEEGVEERG